MNGAPGSSSPTPSAGYYNSTYGYLNQLTYTSSASLDDVTNLSLFGTNSLSLANTYATNPYAMMQHDAAGYLGSATVATAAGLHRHRARPGDAGLHRRRSPKASSAQAWNMNGCWVLASTIAAEAGASLPVQSTLIGLAGQGQRRMDRRLQRPGRADRQLAIHGHRRRNGRDRHAGRRRPYHHLRVRLRQHRHAGRQHHLRERPAARSRTRPTTARATTSSSRRRTPPRRNGRASRPRRW